MDILPDQPGARREGIEIDPATGAATVKLKFPVSVGDRQISELAIRRPKGKDLAATEAIKGGQTRQGLMMIEHLSGEDAISNELDGEDINRISEVVADFLGMRPTTGET